MHVAEYTANINGEVLLPQDRLVDWFVKNPWTDEGGGQCTVTETADGRCLVTFDSFLASFEDGFDRCLQSLEGEQKDGTCGGVMIVFEAGQDATMTPYWLTSTRLPEVCPLYQVGKDNWLIAEHVLAEALVSRNWAATTHKDPCSVFLAHVDDQTEVLILEATHVDPTTYKTVGLPMQMEAWCKVMRTREEDDA